MVYLQYGHLPNILPLKTTIHVGKYTTSPMDGSWDIQIVKHLNFLRFLYGYWYQWQSI